MAHGTTERNTLGLVADEVRDHGDAVCVVGAGPAGLATARALAAHDVEYLVFERHTSLGGIWDVDIPGGPMYEAAHLISSRDTSSFHGFPMPSGYPDYPGHRQVLAYLNSFAEHYALTDRIVFGVTVTRVSMREDGRWLVETDDGRRFVFRAVACATGSQWYPRTPELAGKFAGVITHAQEFRSSAEFAGTRTLVVGAGNSGCDIACEVGRVADQCFLSLRRGYWVIPKHIAGVPTDRLGGTAGRLPRRVDQALSSAVVRLAVGDLQRFGLRKPDHRIYETHPIINSRLPHALAHGDVIAKPDVRRLDGARVHFTDGSAEDIDRIILATGYRLELPYAAEYFHGLDEQHTYLTTFSRAYPNLFFVGMAESNTGGFMLFDTAAQLIAQFVAAQHDGSRTAATFADRIARARPDLSGGTRLLDSPRHESYVDADAFLRAANAVTDELGWQRAKELAARRTKRRVARTSPFRFEGAIAMVTGAAGGLGTHICRELAERGVTVVAADRDARAAEQVVRGLVGVPGPAHRAVGVDLAEPGAATALLDAVSDLGRLDVLVNNAATSHDRAFDVLEQEEIERELRVNLLTPIQLTRAALDLLDLAAQPRVVFVGSLGGIIAMGSDPLYSASKFGLRGSALSLHLMLGQRGIKVSAVHPSAVDTPMLEREARSNPELSQFLSPPQSPEHVARTVLAAIERPKPEHYPSPFEAVQAKVAMLAPNALARILPLVDRLGAAGLERYRARKSLVSQALDRNG